MPDTPPKQSRHGLYVKSSRLRLDVASTIYDVSLRFDRVEESTTERLRLENPAAVPPVVAGLFEENPQQEMFCVLLLDRKNRLIARHRVTTGTNTSSLVHPREVFRTAIMCGAAAIIVSHNHPSGDPAPSSGDIQVTRQLREAARVVDIELHDHVIVGAAASDPSGRGYFSFRSAGIL